MYQTVPYLAGATNEQLNFEAGENVLLKLEPTARYTKLPADGTRPEDASRGWCPHPATSFWKSSSRPTSGSGR